MLSALVNENKQRGERMNRVCWSEKGHTSSPAEKMENERVVGRSALRKNGEHIFFVIFSVPSLLSLSFFV